MIIDLELCVYAKHDHSSRAECLAVMQVLNQPQGSLEDYQVRPFRAVHKPFHRVLKDFSYDSWDEKNGITA